MYRTKAMEHCHPIYVNLTIQAVVNLYINSGTSLVIVLVHHSLQRIASVNKATI